MLALVVMFMVKLLVIVVTGHTVVMGASTRGPLGEEVMGSFFDVPAVNEQMLT